MNDTSRILIVEDDEALASELIRGLEHAGWRADHVSCLADAFEAVIQRNYRVVLLDRTLPDGDGLSLVAAVKSRPNPPPVIILSARDRIADRVQGLDAGADDYLIKPFAFGELLARLRAAARRKSSPHAKTPPVALGNLTFDADARQVDVGGSTINLPRRELALLEILLRGSGRVLQREFLETELFGIDSDSSTNALETQVSRLRRRLTAAGADIEVRTVRGIGYMIRPC